MTPETLESAHNSILIGMLAIVVAILLYGLLTSYLRKSEEKHIKDREQQWEAVKKAYEKPKKEEPVEYTKEGKQ